MVPIDIERLINWAEGEGVSSLFGLKVKGISTDTRTIKPGDIYIPLVGERFDGHNFIEQAQRAGAIACFSSREDFKAIDDRSIVKVKDTLESYQKIAKNYRKMFSVPVVAVTGSNGKTTTKDIIFHILKSKFKVLATEKNFNNEIGVPQTLLKLDNSYDVVVLEFGMRGLGQIKELTEIAYPDVTVITNIGESHFELLGSYEAIAQAKCEILEYSNIRGFSILNADDRWFEYSKNKALGKIFTFGINNKADVQLFEKKDLGLGGYFLKIKIENDFYSFILPLMGVHNIYNSLSSIAVAYNIGLAPDDIIENIKNVKSSDKRLELFNAPGGWNIINDTYNASPSSMGKALEIMGDLNCKGFRIAILGDMLELGEIAVSSHRKIGAMVNEVNIDFLHVLGDLGKEIGNGALMAGMSKEKVYFWDNKKEIIDYFQENLKGGDLVLVKGSRLMKMEELVDGLMN